MVSGKNNLLRASWQRGRGDCDGIHIHIVCGGRLAAVVNLIPD
jgi:hypothetical protein